MSKQRCSDEDLAAVDAAGFRQRAGDGRNVVFVGDRGTGKSTLARWLALAALTDSRGRPYKGVLGIYVTPNGQGTDPWPGPSFDLEALEKLLAEDAPELPPLMVVRGGPAAYHAAATLAMQAGEAGFRVLLLVDECHRVFREGFGDGTAMAVLFHEGRHRGIDVYFVTQWPARADKRLFRSSDAVWWFRLLTPEDLEWIASRYSVAAAMQVDELPDFEAVRIVKDRPPPEWRWRADDKRRLPSDVVPKNR